MTTDEAAGDGTSDAGSFLRRTFLRSLLILAIAAAVCAALAVVDALRVAREIRAGRAEVASILRLDTSRPGALHEKAVRGLRRFTAARRIAYGSRWLSIWARVPLTSRPADWIRAAATLTESVSRSAAAAIGRIEPDLGSFGGPAQRLRFLGRVEHEFTMLRSEVRFADLPSPGGVLPPLASADRELRGDLRRLRAALGDGIAAARGLRTFLNGPSRYLVLAANNAEMRAGGMVLQVGGLMTMGGRIEAGGFLSTARLSLREPVAVPPQIDGLYGWLSPGTEWRNVGSSPNFPVIAPLYASMAERVGRQTLDGVIQIDVPGVRALLSIVGPVEVAGRRYDQRNVEQLLLHDLYVSFGSDQVERRNEFSRLATATFEALNERSWRLDRLVRALRRAALGRHLLAWSRRPVEQEAWRRLGIDGALERDGLMLTVQNHAGNKLDWFVRPSMDLRIDPRAGGWRRVRLRIRVDNPTPPGQPRYVAGDGRLVPPGDHRALVAVYLPGWATNVEMPGREVHVVGPDGPMRVIGTRVDVARGESVTMDVAFSVPPGVDRLVLLPSARVKPVPVRAGDRLLDDRVERFLHL